MTAAARTARLGLVLALAVIAAACVGTGSRGSGEILRVPSWVPPGLELRGGCVEDDMIAAALGYRGDGRYKSEQRIESAFLRVMAVDLGADRISSEWGVESVLEDAEPDSLSSITVQGVAATAFSFSSGEDPGDVVWPGLVWRDGDSLVWIWGEGLDPASVRRVAEGLEIVAFDEYDQLVGGVRCSS